MGGVRTDTRGRMLKGIMGCCPTFPRMQLALPTYYRLSFPWASLGLALKGWASPSLVLPSVRLGLRGFRLRGLGPLVGGGLAYFGGPGFGCLAAGILVPGSVVDPRKTHARPTVDPRKTASDPQATHRRPAKTLSRPTQDHSRPTVDPQATQGTERGLVAFE